MADRDINIPMGPDRTGEIELPPINFGDEAGAGANQPDMRADYETATRSEVEYAGYNNQLEETNEYMAGGISEDEATAQGIDDVQMSFLALKDSIGQGRELKAREKELDEFSEQLEIDREELADREDILANYQVIVTDQDNLIAQYTQQHDAKKAELAQVNAQLEETTEALNRMREYHDGQMDPFEKNLGRARAYADQAKNDERSRKSELNAAETELRRAEQSDDDTMAVARHEQVRDAYNEARTRSEAAKEALDQAQRAYDDAMAQVEQAETPLEHTIEDLEKQAEELNVKGVDGDNQNDNDGTVKLVCNGASLYIPFAELVDIEGEIARLTKELEKAEGELKRVEGKLSNQGFIAKAPAALVEAETAKKDRIVALIADLNKSIEEMKNR